MSHVTDQSPIWFWLAVHSSNVGTFESTVQTNNQHLVQPKVGEQINCGTIQMWPVTSASQLAVASTQHRETGTVPDYDWYVVREIQQPCFVACSTCCIIIGRAWNSAQ